MNRGRRYLRRVRLFAALPARLRLAIVEATVLLALSRLAVRLLSFQSIERAYGTRLAESPEVLEAHDLPSVQTVARALKIVSPNTVWTSNCLPQATAGKLMLRRRGVPSTLYVGAAFRPVNDDVGERSNELHAHAWLRAGRIAVAGGNGHRDFGAIVSYS